MPRTQGNETNDHSDLQPGEIRSELILVIESEGFNRSPRLCEFLSFLVEDELAGRGKRINGTQIAIDVYGRDQTFDPRTDPVVRTEAGRLRRSLLMALPPVSGLLEIEKAADSGNTGRSRTSIR